MKQIILCDGAAYHITEEDFEQLKEISPGIARLVRDSDEPQPTHFVCPKCGQFPPLALREVHDCQSVKG